MEAKTPREGLLGLMWKMLLFQIVGKLLSSLSIIIIKPNIIANIIITINQSNIGKETN